jgi:hypothetical protein
MQSSGAETLGKVLENKVKQIAARQEQGGKHFSTSCAHWALCICSIFQISGCQIEHQMLNIIAKELLDQSLLNLRQMCCLLKVIYL